jgi:hypothetical protein
MNSGYGVERLRQEHAAGATLVFTRIAKSLRQINNLLREAGHFWGISWHAERLAVYGCCPVVLIATNPAIDWDQPFDTIFVGGFRAETEGLKSFLYPMTP